MNIEEIKSEVIYSEDQSRLFELTIILNEEISSLHIDLIKAKDSVHKAEIKAKISLLTALQGIIEKRLPDVRTREFYSNRRFRYTAELVLKEETIARILELSSIPNKELKKIKSELKANKLE